LRRNKEEVREKNAGLIIERKRTWAGLTCEGQQADVPLFLS
jgi:hypothetical protein